MSARSVNDGVPHTTWAQDPEDRFQDAEYYGMGVVCVVAGARRAVVECEGETHWSHEDGTMLRTAAEFRAAFPEGVIPMDGENGWSAVNNGWFAVYVDGEESGEPVYSLSEAHQEAITLAGPPARQAEVDPPARRGTLAEAMRSGRSPGP